MSKREWVTPEGLRGDGRRARELRRLRVELGVLPHADGSACVEMGNTKVRRGRRGEGARRERRSPPASHAFDAFFTTLSPPRSWPPSLARACLPVAPWPATPPWTCGASLLRPRLPQVRG